MTPIGSQSNGKDASGLRVAVTGAGGFVGRRLTSALGTAHPGWLLEEPPGPEAPSGLDITEPQAVEDWIRRVQPDVVVHLAAVAAVTASVKDPRLAWRVNLDGTLNLVLALQQHAPRTHLLFVSSAEVYGESLNSATPVDERALLQPVNPYAASKAAADILVRQAAASGLSATVARPFNHTGPGQGDAFVAPNFAAQVARIEAGLQPPVISVGALDDERDFLDLGDVVDAYLLMLDRRAELGRGAVLNIASGEPVRIGDILEHLLSLSRVKIEVTVDPSRLRASGIRRVTGDATRLRALGWSPRISLSDTLAAVLEDKRRAIASV
jgi:GDP-4-dehydro-6-deoxy-D-mannose reductase